MKLVALKPVKLVPYESNTLSYTLENAKWHNKIEFRISITHVFWADFSLLMIDCFIGLY